MGGIKNKLSKLIHESPFRKRGVVPVALRVGVPLTSQRYNDSRYNNRISIGGFDRVSKFTKYTSLACLSLVILSTLILNIVSSYSSSNIESNAEPVSNSPTSTLANIDPASISISISSYPSSSSTGGNNPNLSLLIPQGGGIATGRHTVTVSTGSGVIGYELQLSSDSDETGLVNNDASDNEDSTSSEGNPSSNPTIPTTTGTTTNPSQLADKTYGYTLTDLSNGGVYGSSASDASDTGASNSYSSNPVVTTPIWSGLQPKSNPATIATVDETDNTLTIGQPNETTHNIYYGVNIQNPVGTRAGNYSRDVVYTAIGEVALPPTIQSIEPNSYVLSSNSDNAATITGSNLTYVNSVYLRQTDNDNKEYASTINQVSETEISIAIPTDKTEPGLTAGEYDVCVRSPQGEDCLTKGFSYTEPEPIIESISPRLIEINNSHIKLTIAGQNLIDYTQVYIDFNRDHAMQSYEQCTGLIASPTSISCTAPLWNTGGESYPLVLHKFGSTDDLYIDNAITYDSYTISVSSVSPNKVSASRYANQPIEFTVMGEGLDHVNAVILQGDDRWSDDGTCVEDHTYSGVMGSIVSTSLDKLVFRLERWPFCFDSSSNYNNVAVSLLNSANTTIFFSNRLIEITY